jgi:3-oxoacyl-[acyl-carrier protein] reductase
MEKQNDHKVAIITGASSGIGRAIAACLAAEGVYIAGVSRNKEKVAEALDEIRTRYGVECLPLRADVSQENDVDAMVTQALEKFGRIDVLVNNAGVGFFGRVVDSKAEEWEKTIDINLKGVYLCSKAVLPRMIERKSGTIINISSVCGLRGNAGCAIYCASKFGIVGFTESLAHEAKPFNVSVSAVCPHAVDTEFGGRTNLSPVNSARMILPEDVARLVCALATGERKPQICEIRLRPRTLLDRFLRRTRRISMVKTITRL